MTTFLKLLMVPLYHSTDFDVHRNWLAITHNLPVNQWYIEATSEWTLDYPPFFAWFEWFLSQFAAFFDPQMLRISAEPYASTETIIFQRLTVILSDLVLFYALRSYCQRIEEDHLKENSGRRNAKEKRLKEVNVLVFAFSNPGLLFVDHIHFQYNGLLMGIFIYTFSKIKQGKDLQAGILFAVLLNFKHIFLYVAPVFFVYLLRSYVYEVEEISYRGYEQFSKRTSSIRRKFSWWRLFCMGSVVIAVFAASLGPIIAAGQLKELAGRLFPFKRGLCHAYWAPNFWALYNFIDLVGTAVIKMATGVDLRANVGGSLTSGLVQDISHAMLPNVPPIACAILTLLSMLPVLVTLWKNPHPRLFPSAVVYATFCSFMFGWHVHEKAILMIIIPLSLSATEDANSSRLFLLANVIGNFSLFPLIFTRLESVFKVLLLFLHTVTCYYILDEETLSLGRKRRIVMDLLRPGDWKYLYLGLLVQIYVTFGHPILFPHLQFLPLLLVSIYCCFGTIYCWILCWSAHSRAVDRLLSYRDDDADEDE